jgi:N6-adenosine-specific RNA methylase IME4
MPLRPTPFRYPQTRFHALVADAPWMFEDKGSRSGAEKHYNVMTMYDLRHFPLPLLTDDAPLFFWRVAAMQEEALRVIRAWGFVPKTELVWVKMTSGEEDAKLAFGQGHYTRAAHETCIIAVRDEKKWKPKVRNQRDVFHAPVGKHSAKPEEFYRIVERMVGPGPIAELFARRTRHGFLTVGYEIPGGGVFTP